MRRETRKASHPIHQLKKKPTHVLHVVISVFAPASHPLSKGMDTHTHTQAHTRVDATVSTIAPLFLECRFHSHTPGLRAGVCVIKVPRRGRGVECRQRRQCRDASPRATDCQHVLRAQ